MNRFETVLSQDGTHILTTDEGDVSITQTLSAMAREAALLAEHPDVRYVVFDYRGATMASQRSKDVQLSADAAARMLDEHPAITFIGVAPQQIDYGVARMFEQHVETMHTASDARQRTFMVRSMEEARALMTGVTTD